MRLFLDIEKTSMIRMVTQTICLYALTFFLEFTVGNLAVKVLFGLSYMLKDHKTQPLSDYYYTSKNYYTRYTNTTNHFHYQQVTVELEKVKVRVG